MTNRCEIILQNYLKTRDIDLYHDYKIIYNIICFLPNFTEMKSGTKDEYLLLDKYEQEYINDIIGQFKDYNIRPLVLNDILDFYNDEITDNYNNDKQPREFVDMIVKDMELDSGGFMSQRVGSAGWNNKVIKYL